MKCTKAFTLTVAVPIPTPNFWWTFQNAAPFLDAWLAIGKTSLGGPNVLWDELGFWKSKLSVANLLDLYNGGIGRTFPFT
jgi:hypothetical protein